MNDELKQYWSYRDELSITDGVIFKSDRVVIPKKLRSEMFKQLRIPHMGIEKTKLSGRESMFRPGVNREMEDMVKKFSPNASYVGFQYKTKLLMTSNT